jgi:hypothetical protein
LEIQRKPIPPKVPIRLRNGQTECSRKAASFPRTDKVEANRVSEEGIHQFLLSVGLDFKAVFGVAESSLEKKEGVRKFGLGFQVWGGRVGVGVGGRNKYTLQYSNKYFNPNAGKL